MGGARFLHVSSERISKKDTWDSNPPLPTDLQSLHEILQDVEEVYFKT